MRISGIAVVSSIAIPETVSLSSLEFQVSHNTSCGVHCADQSMVKLLCTMDQRAYSGCRVQTIVIGISVCQFITLRIK